MSGVRSENARAGLKPDTPGPDLTYYESGRKDIIRISCSEQYESVISHQGGLKPMLGEGCITLGNVQNKELFS